MRKLVITATVLTVALSIGAACATKKYVQEQVGGVNSKVDTLGKGLEETQQRQRQTDDKLAGVDQKAGQAGTAASAAQQSANAAGSKADAASASANAANAKAAELEKAAKRLMYTVVIDESQGHFKLNDSTLPDGAKAKIDQLMAQITANPNGAYFEVEGYTDTTGAAETNKKLGLARAEAVRDYLYKQHHVPLHRISVISYGEENPVADNKTRDGRAQNRRVVIKVLN